MHILLVADGRSPTTRSYIEMLQSGGFHISLASTYPCAPIPGLQHWAVVPLALNRFAGQAGETPVAAGSPMGRAGPLHRMRQRASPWARQALYPLRYLVGPLSIRWQRRRYVDFLAIAQPDVVHALRIPFEGMLATSTPPHVPLALSIWGNDLTLHARASCRMRQATMAALRRADGLAADTQRDLRLAAEWGFDSSQPALLIPGSGGLPLESIDQRRPAAAARLPEPLHTATTLVVNPRGFRPGSVRSDTFFRSIPLVTQHLPDVQFACAAMQAVPEARVWVERLQIGASTLLLPTLPQESMWELFRLAQVSVSISQHDGTPNSLLEAMACGCFPVAGDIESLREWIVSGENGLLVDPADPEALAGALLTALGDAELRRRAAAFNRSLVEERAARHANAARARAFYESLV